MKIRVEKITLDFYPNWGTAGTNCDIMLNVRVDDVNNLHWKGSDVHEKDAKLIHECLSNKSMALLNTRNEIDHVSFFCKLKVEHFEDENPTANWKQYQIWCNLKRKRDKILEQFSKAEQAVWASGNNKSIPDSNYDEVFKRIHEQIIQTPSPSPCIPVQPYNPIWIDHTGTPPSDITYNTTTYGVINNADDCAISLLNSNLPDTSVVEDNNDDWEEEDEFFKQLNKPKPKPSSIAKYLMMEKNLIPPQPL